MSSDQLTAFIAAIAADPTLRQHLRAEGANPVAIAQSAGFVINEDEFLRHVSSSIPELADDELEAAAGGLAGKSSKKEACTNGCACQQLTIPASAGTLDPCMAKCAEP